MFYGIGFMDTVDGDPSAGLRERADMGVWGMELGAVR